MGASYYLFSCNAIFCVQNVFYCLKDADILMHCAPDFHGTCTGHHHLESLQHSISPRSQ